MKDKPSFPARLAGWEYQYERAEKLQQQNAALVEEIAYTDRQNKNLLRMVERQMKENKQLMAALIAADDIMGDVYNVVDEDNFNSVWKQVSQLAQAETEK